MPARTRLPLPLRGRVFTTAEATAHGMTPAQLRGPLVRRVFRGLYCDAALPPQIEPLLHAALRLLPPGSGISGPHAVAVHGLPLPLVAGGHGLSRDERLAAIRLHVCSPASGLRKNDRPGLEIGWTDLPAGHVQVVRGVSVLAPERLLLELANQGWTRDDLVALVDGALHSHQVTLERLRAAVDWAVGRRGCRLARLVVGLADAGAESPMETRIRLVMVDAGLPRPQVNQPVRHAGRIVCRPDLSYPQWRLAVEYDGADHADAVRRARDEARRVALRALGWTVLTFTSQEVLLTPELVVARVRAEIALAEAAAAGGAAVRRVQG